jgi:hypothetical protein
MNVMVTRKARRDREGFSPPPSEQEFLLRSERGLDAAPDADRPLILFSCDIS